MFKAATVPSEPVKGVLDAFDVAARQFQVDRRTLLGRGEMFIHGTTHAINAIVTKQTAKTALLVTSGHPDILVLREGGRLEPFNHAVPYPDPYIPRSLTFEVPERVLASGEIRRPLDEAAVADIADRLARLGVEAVAVCLLWSVLHPQHERRVGEILASRLPGVPVTLSHLLNPALREYRRAISAALDASLKPLMNRYLAGLTTFDARGGIRRPHSCADLAGRHGRHRRSRRAPILAINSGPSMAPIAGARLAACRCAEQRRHHIRHRRNHVRRLAGAPGPRAIHPRDLARTAVAERSHGVSLGRCPEHRGRRRQHRLGRRGQRAACRSAKRRRRARSGLLCGGRPHATVTDAALVLGYIDPSFFLGGRIRLDRNAAMAAVQRDVAGPLGMTLEAAASAIMAVWSENMVQAISDITVNQGIDPAKAVIVGGGGAAGLNALTIAERLGCEQLIIPEVGAALSAFGAIVSDIAREYRRVFVTSTAQFDRDGAAAIVADLCAKALAFAETAGAEARDVQRRFSGRGAVPASGLGDRRRDRAGSLVRGRRRRRPGAGLSSRPRAHLRILRSAVADRGHRLARRRPLSRSLLTQI